MEESARARAIGMRRGEEDERGATHVAPVSISGPPNPTLSDLPGPPGTTASRLQASGSSTLGLRVFVRDGAYPIQRPGRLQIIFQPLTVWRHRQKKDTPRQIRGTDQMPWTGLFGSSGMLWMSGPLAASCSLRPTDCRYGTIFLTYN